MHPIERLRYVARSSGASQEVLVRETAGALAALGFDPPGLVTACRRILDRHPLSGPLWWLSARVLTSNDANNEAWNAADEVTADDTGANLVLLEASAIGPTGFIGVAGSRAAAATARHAGVPVWLVGGIGRLLPRRMWDALVGRLDVLGEPWELDDEHVPLDLVDRIAMPTGILPVDEALKLTDCPIAPELFKSIDPL